MSQDGSTLKAGQSLTPFSLAVDPLSTVSLCVVIQTDPLSDQYKAPGPQSPGLFSCLVNVVWEDYCSKHGGGE